MQPGKPDPSVKGRAMYIAVLAACGGSVLACCGVGVLFLPPAIQQAREARRRQQTVNNLRQIREPAEFKTQMLNAKEELERELGGSG